jgi:hypothetical protein
MQARVILVALAGAILGDKRTRAPSGRSYFLNAGRPAPNVRRFLA